MTNDDEIRQQREIDEEFAYHQAAVILDGIMVKAMQTLGATEEAMESYYDFLDDEELFNEREKSREAFEKKQSKPC